MPWLIRLLFHAHARLLFRECAAYTLAEYGDAAAAKLLGEIDPGTPLSGRLPIWLMIAEVRRQARGRDVSRSAPATLRQDGALSSSGRG